MYVSGVRVVLDYATFGMVTKGLEFEASAVFGPAVSGWAPLIRRSLEGPSRRTHTAVAVHGGAHFSWLPYLDHLHTVVFLHSGSCCASSIKFHHFVSPRHAENTCLGCIPCRNSYHVEPSGRSRFVSLRYRTQVLAFLTTKHVLFSMQSG